MSAEVATSVDRAVMPLDELLKGWSPGSADGRTWDEEEADILARVCLCCGEAGHYQRQLEDHLRENGLTQGVCLGTDGRVWDGHHRIVAARRLGIVVIPLESGEDAGERWLRDHGPVDWAERKTGDRLSSTRPLTPEAPEGWHYEAVEEDRRRWRIIPPERQPRKCRWTIITRKACGAPAEAEFDRGRQGRQQWWAYCGVHLYGRWIENGRIMHWRLVENEGGDSG